MSAPHKPEPPLVRFSSHESERIVVTRIDRTDPAERFVVAEFSPGLFDGPETATLIVSSVESETDDASISFMSADGESSPRVELRPGESAPLLMDRRAIETRTGEAGEIVIVLRRSFPGYGPAEGRMLVRFRFVPWPPEVSLVAWRSTVNLDSQPENEPDIAIGTLEVRGVPAGGDEGPGWRLRLVGIASAPEGRTRVPLVRFRAEESQGAEWSHTDAGFEAPEGGTGRFTVGLRRDEIRRVLRDEAAAENGVSSLLLHVGLRCLIIDETGLPAPFRDENRSILLEATRRGALAERLTISMEQEVCSMDLSSEGVAATFRTPVEAVWRRETEEFFNFLSGSLLRFALGEDAERMTLRLSAALGPTPLRDESAPPIIFSTRGGGLEAPLMELIAPRVFDRSGGPTIGDRPCRIDGELIVERDGSARSYPVTIALVLRLAADVGGWVVAIDFGAAATAVRACRTDGSKRVDLRLGALLNRLSPSASGEDEGDEMGTAPLFLPSVVGLTPRAGLRSRGDRLSFPDLLRIEAVGPAVCESALESGDVSAIVRRVKQRIIEADDPHLPPRSLHGMSHPPDLMIAWFSGLGHHVLPNALLLQARDDPDAAAFREDWLDGVADISVLLACPTGLDPAGLDLYREAGRGFCEAFAGAGAATLIPEALAAARSGVERFLADRGRHIPAGHHLFVALDIGASASDVAIIEADLAEGALRGWEILAHFSFQIGGDAFDRLLMKRIASLLDATRSRKALAHTFEIAPRLPTWVDQYYESAARAGAEIPSEALALIRAFQIARTRAIQGAADSEDGSVSLRMKVGDRRAEAGLWPVALKRRCADREVPIDRGAKLVFLRDDVMLDVPASLFEADEAVTALIDFFGTRLPLLASNVARSGAHGGGARPIFLLSGRGALWPAIIRRIRETARSLDGDVFGPFPPDDMKTAIVDGALSLALAREQVLGAGRAFEELAVLSLRGGRPSDIRYLRNSRAAVGDDVMTLDGECALVLALPGLERESLSFFNALAATADGAFCAPPWRFEAKRRPLRFSRQQKVAFRWRRADEGVTVSIKSHDVVADLSWMSGARFGPAG